MKSFFLTFLIFTTTVFGQVHNRLLKFSAGVTYDQFAHQNVFEAMNDTSSNEFELVTTMPFFAYSHEFVLSDIISISGRVGFQYLNEYYNHQYFGSPLLLISANPQISVFYRNGFEYYIKLQAGLDFWFMNKDLLTAQERRYFPERVNFFTGVTIGGFNYFISDHLGLNLELNLWSPDLATFGITYRYFKGELPVIQDTKEM